MRKIYFLLIACLLSLIGKAQQMTPGDIPTPNATDLGMYGNIPVSYYTGRPNITIPILDMKASGGMVLPIYLQHDASGVMVNSLPGWTGHNWTLMAGGAITRTIEGFADEYEPINQSSVYPFTNYFHSCGQLRKDINNDAELTKNVEFIMYDYSPDIFYFNFMGISGRFFMGNDGQWKVLSDRNLDIVFDVNDAQNYIAPFIEKMPGVYSGRKQPKVIKGFIIRDNQVFIYEFGGDNRSIEYSTNFFAQTEYESVESWYATSWYLTKVKDKYGNTLFTLDYERGKFIAQLYNSASSIYVYEKAKGLGVKYGQEYYNNNYLFPYGGTLNAPVYLKHVTSENHVVVNFISSDSPVATSNLYPSINIFKAFDNTDYSSYMPFFYLQSDRNDVKPYQYNANSGDKNVYPLSSTCIRKLDEIQLCNIDSQYIARKIKFTYSMDSRMHLVRYSYCDLWGTEAYSYELEYNNYNYLPKDYLSTAVDHWGYYTGTDYRVDANMYVARKPVPNRTTYGLLNKIIYPTGGYSKLSYEQNDFSKCVHPGQYAMFDTTSVAGGVRIKEIAEYSRKGELLQKKTFDYKNPYTGKSSGELFAAPCYYWGNWMANLNASKAVAKQSISRSSSIMPLSNSFGPHIGYSYVTETNADSSKTVFHYMNMSGTEDERFIKDFSDGKPSPFDRFTDRGYKRGNLLDVTAYDGNGKKQKKTEYSYPKENVEDDYVLTSNLRYVNNGASATFSYYTGGVYKLLFPKYDVVGNRTVTYYEGNDSLVDIQKFNKRNLTMDITYTYPHKTIVRLLDSESLTRKHNTITQNYVYGMSDGSEAGKQLCQRLFSLEPTQYRVYNNDKLMGGEKTIYQMYSNMPLPLYLYKLYPIGSKLWIRYLSYYPNYKLKTYQKIGEAVTKLTWGGSDVYAKDIGVDANGNKLPGTHHYYITINDLEGVGDVVYPNGKFITHEYDSFGRLMEIEDDHFRPVTRFYYHYGK